MNAKHVIKETETMHALHNVISLPTAFTDKYTADDISRLGQVIRWLNDTSAGPEDSHSQARLGRLAAIKQTTLNNILHGNYPSPVSKYIDRLLDVIAREEQRLCETMGDNQFVETSVYHYVRAACHRAHLYRSFGIVSCYVGTGKTWALKHYIEQHPNAILVESIPNMNVTAILRSITDLCGADVAKTNRYSRAAANDMMTAIIKKLSGSDTLIIIDEAEKVAANALEYVRRICDLAKVGVVLCGTEYLLPMIRSPRGRFGQVSSRVLFWPQVIKEITYTDACQIVAAALGKQIELGDELLKTFYRVSDGSARVLARALIPAVHDYGIRKGKTITPALVATLGKELLGYHTGAVGR